MTIWLPYTLELLPPKLESLDGIVSSYEIRAPLIEDYFFSMALLKIDRESTRAGKILEACLN
jgi:hypothetical protein